MRHLFLIASFAVVTAGACSFANAPAEPVEPGETGGTATTTMTSAMTGGAGGANCVASSCPGMDTDCQKRACVDGACGFIDELEGTPCAAEEGGQCDGVGKCLAATCTDSKKNGAETDLDCGGGCPACAVGQACGLPADCKTNLCQSGVCGECNKIADCAKGTFCDPDGTCAPQKEPGEPCGVSFECTTGLCADGVCCQEACNEACFSCSSLNSIGADGECAPVKLGGADLACTLGACDGSGACACANGKLDVGETDVDCGGMACAKCNGGELCKGPSDCAIGFCADGVCCNSACSGKCQSCLAIHTGGTDGKCTPIKHGLDPNNECGSGACSSEGFCKLDSGQTCGFDATCLTGACVKGTCHAPATCTDLLTSANVWGVAAKGFDLVSWTESTLHFLGCSTSAAACVTGSFYCFYDPVGQTLKFGTTSTTGVVRAVVDPGNVGGDVLSPGTSSTCCSANNSFGACNAPDSKNNGVSFGATTAQALCSQLGYETGTLVRESGISGCPQVHASGTLDAPKWATDFVDGAGAGMEWVCSGFK